MIEQLWLFHCGFFRAPQNVFTGTGSFRMKKFPFLAMLAVHSELGPIVIDAPFGHEGPQNAGFLANGALSLLGPKFNPRWSIIERIRQIGYKSADVDNVLMTHLHFDHTGGMKELAHAKFFVHAQEWKYANSDAANLAKGFSKQDYQALGNVKTFSLPEEKDLFGDGSICAIDLRGHTPGQVGYRFKLANGEEVIHVGDAAYTLAQISGEESLGKMSKVASHNYEQAVASLQSLRQLAIENPEIKWITSHDDGLGRLCENGPVSLLE